MTQNLRGQVSDDWCIDNPKLNQRFPIYTRFNANDVLPDPITPLGADLIWNPHILPGFSNAYAEMGCISVAEANVEPEAMPAAGFRYGHLYVNVTTARLTGIRSGLGWEAIDASFFGSHPDAPPHETHPDDGDPAIAERLADEMGLYSSPLQRMGMLSADAWRAARLVVDTGLHAHGNGLASRRAPCRSNHRGPSSRQW